MLPTGGRPPEAVTWEESPAQSAFACEETPDVVREVMGEIDAEAILGLVDAAPDGIVMADERGSILFVNRRTEELFGYRRQELLGRSVEELLPEPLRQVHRARTVRATGPSLACVRWAPG